jgi:hypothetical protein
VILDQFGNMRVRSGRGPFQGHSRPGRNNSQHGLNPEQIQKAEGLLGRVIWPAQPRLQKYFCFLLTQITGLFRAVSSLTEGRIAIVTDVGMGCGEREGAFDEQR